MHAVAVPVVPFVKQPASVFLELVEWILSSILLFVGTVVKISVSLAPLVVACELINNWA